MFREDLYKKYLKDVEEYPPVNYSTDTVHSVVTFEKIIVDEKTGCEFRIIRVENGSYRGYITIPESHPYINHPEFSDKARATIDVHDGMDYGNREHWGISFSDGYVPLYDEHGLYESSFEIDSKNLFYWNFNDVKTEMQRWALQFHNLKC